MAWDQKKATPEPHLDPITKEPGAHPIGTAAGSSTGALAGAAIGAAVAGPPGALVGGTIGAVGGGLAGHTITEKTNPTMEDEYWRTNYTSRPYVKPGITYDEYQPAYRYGWESRTRHAGQRFDEVETDLERGWDRAKGKSRLAWNEARDATRDAWHRIEERLPGDADRDGR
jgi:hypothetical protein